MSQGLRQKIIWEVSPEMVIILAYILLIKQSNAHWIDDFFINNFFSDNVSNCLLNYYNELLVTFYL